MYTIVIGAQTLHATGYAMGITMDGKVGGDDGEAVIAYFGDGATSQGDVNEAFIWSSVFNAPMVFFCQNNQYAISEPLERQTRVPLYQRAAGFGFPGIRVDGNDVLASLRGHPRRARQRAPRPGPDPDRGVHLPDGRAHHLRRPDPLPHRQRGRGVAGQGPDHAGHGRSWTSSRSPTTRSSTRSTTRRRVEAVHLRERVLVDARPGAGARCSTTFTRTVRR